MTADMGIASLDVEAMLAFGEQGQIYPIKNLIDVDGDETEQAELAVVAVVRIGPDCWAVVPLLESDFK